ncbi:uncharacterized protein N7459_003858 [Penicillium hispanicum]|uniref:uncharacterized protein n=1 Tax=Penicillium hispanicum TaxID=1080232 RepID=UPI002541C174|nr:uncharacterized protein N7459_003858 [Penicillium hispanicum]KAJ5584058.1 hypothetical protein N7459_003858 [Penicillium hispanicum]
MTSRVPSAWDDDGHSDPPSTRSSNEPPEHPAHFRSRSTAHVLAHAHSPKRLSVFSGRSRSNTTTSTSSHRSPNSSMTSSMHSSTDGSFASSHDERTGSALGLRDKPERSSRSFLARGSRILRRQGSKINIVATLDEEDEISWGKPRADKPDIFGRRGRQVDQHDRLKSLISDPFDFHHLTHTNPSQFQSLDQTRENDLVTEFSAIRASQRPETGLKGIRAEDIHFRNFSTDDLAQYGTATTVDEPAPQSSPGSPQPSSLNSSTRHVRRESRVFENFSRPVSRYPRSPPTTPPPVVAEVPAEGVEPAPRAIDEILGLSTAKTYPEDIEPGPSSTRLPFSPDAADDLTARTSSVNSHYDLEDVPEEEEATRYWDSPEPSIGGGHSRSASQVSPPLIEAHPPTTTAAKAPLSIFVAEELSRKFSEALGSPTLPRSAPNGSPKARQAHVDGTPMSTSCINQFSYEDELYDSWDADIDYCYEHAAESTSNFDWSRTSLDETQRPQVGVARSDVPWLAAPKTRHLQPSPLSTSTLPTPELDVSPARSTPVHSTATPSMTEYERDFITRNAGDYFQPVSSSILPSALGKQIPQETLYEDYLAADAESDRHFPFYSQAMMSSSEHNPVSPRSSFSPISKCNSQESFMLSRAASIVRKHRSSLSTTSVPELVYSLSSSRELMPTDRLSAAEALASGPATSRPTSSSYHRQTKSLAEAHLLSQADSTPSLVGADTTAATAPAHDRAKSTSEVDTWPVKADGPPIPPIPPKHPNRKKTRTTSYSLFPTAAH